MSDNTPANDEMVQGYMDGLDPDSPEPSANRSHSYRHGFARGRDDRAHRVSHAPTTLHKMADAAMAADAALTTQRDGR